MERVLFITVVYSENPSKTTTLLSLSELDYSKFNINPVFSVWDNSTNGYGLSSIPNMPGEVFYYHTGNNEYLSKVYNNVICKQNDVDWVVILDDDSVIDESYLNALLFFFKSGLNLAVPMIECCGELISPGIQRGVRGRKLSLKTLDVDVISSKYIVAMMSGTIIRRTLFNQGLLFDERLSFYGVDTRFFIDFSKKNKDIFLLNTKMNHHSALRDINEPYASQLKRFKNLFLAKKIIFEDLPFVRVRLIVYLLLFILNQSIKRRTLSFVSLLSVISKII